MGIFGRFRKKKEPNGPYVAGGVLTDEGTRPVKPPINNDEDPFSERVVAELMEEGLTVNWQYGYRLANRYEVKRVCSGGQGIVFIVEDLMEKGKRYAAKTLKAYFRKPSTEGEWERWRDSANGYLRECNIWVNLGKHPHIVHAEYLEKIEGVPLVMSEFIDGGSLKDWLAKGPLDTATALDLAIQACIGMEYANKKGVIVHRDIKPGNILVTRDGVAKINDFGIAKALESAETIRLDAEPPKALDSASLLVSRGKGTPSYMAPEQFPGFLLDLLEYPVVPLGRGSDIYAFGLVLYEMITGRRVVEIESDREVEIRHEAFNIASRFNIDPNYVYCFLKALRCTPPRPSGNRHLNAAILKCLAKEPSKRYHSFTELREELMQIYREETRKGFHVVYEPVYEPNWRNRGKTCWILGREKESFECYDKALEQNPADTLAWLEKGLASAEAGDLREFGLCMDIVPYLKPSKEKEVQRYKKEILTEHCIRPRDVRFIDRLSREYAVSGQIRAWVLSEVKEFTEPFHEPNPVLTRLLDDLKDENPHVRLKAAEALGELGDRLAIPALVQALHDEHFRVQWWAAEALAKLGDRSGMPVLVEILKYELQRMKDDIVEDQSIFSAAYGDQYFWIRAAKALDMLRDESGVSALAEALKDADSDTRSHFAMALGIKAILKDDEESTRPRTEGRDKLSDKAYALVLMEGLKDRHYGKRVEAAMALAKLGDRSGMPVLMEALKDPYYMMKAAMALGELGEKSAVTTMVEALKDDSYIVRQKAAEALGRLGDTSATSALIEALKDEEVSVREKVVEAIGKLCDKSAIPALIEALIPSPDSIRVFVALRLVCSKPDKVKFSQIKDKFKAYSSLEWYEKGLELAVRGEYKEACKCFEKAIGIDPDWEAPKKARDKYLRTSPKVHNSL